MKAAGRTRRGLLAAAISLVIVALGVGALVYALRWRAAFPSTDDASIDADVVHVASPVGGRIVAIPVTENSYVRKGDLLFQIDPEPYRLTVAQTQADLALARAQLATQTRFVSTQRSTAVVAADRIGRATSNLELAQRTVQRLRPLAQEGYVPSQQLDQAVTAEHDAEVSLTQAKVQSAAALRAVDTTAATQATIQAREAALAIARHALSDTTVRATQDGRVVGLTALAGETVIPSQSLFTLVASDEWFAVANFREFDLSSIAVGDCATVYSLIDWRKPIRGIVQGIGAGVVDQDRINLPRSAPYVERSLNWVRVAQRFPVRIRLEGPPPRLVRLGASAVVEVRHGPACRR